MYHISNDKRSAQSAELIYKGLLHCLKHKPFDQITITDVQRASGVARTTIYRCFDNLTDVLNWRCDRCFREALHTVPPAEKPSEWALMQGYFAYWTEHGDMLQLLADINRQDIIYACHMKNARELEQFYGRLPGLDEVNSRYFMAIRNSVTIGVLKAWLTGGRKETAEELAQILKTQLGFLAASFSDDRAASPKDVNRLCGSRC